MKMGLKVGLFDSDIYGPSLPTMVNSADQYLFQDERDPSFIKPVLFSGVKCMSYGFAQKKSAIARGPIVSNLVQ